MGQETGALLSVRGVTVRFGGRLPEPPLRRPLEREPLMKFNGKSWELFGKVYGR